MMPTIQITTGKNQPINGIQCRMPIALPQRQLIAFAVIGSAHQHYPQDDAYNPDNDGKEPADKRYPVQDAHRYTQPPEHHYRLRGVEAHPLVFLFQYEEDDAGNPYPQVAQHAGDVGREVYLSFR